MGKVFFNVRVASVRRARCTCQGPCHLSCRVPLPLGALHAPSQLDCARAPSEAPHAAVGTSSSGIPGRLSVPAGSWKERAAASSAPDVSLGPQWRPWVLLPRTSLYSSRVPRRPRGIPEPAPGWTIGNSTRPPSASVVPGTCLGTQGAPAAGERRFSATGVWRALSHSREGKRRERAPGALTTGLRSSGVS